MRKILAALAAVLMLVALTGCGESASEKSAEKTIEKALEDDSGQDADVDIEDDKITVESEDGKVTIGGTDRPESLPDDFPLVDGEILTALDSPEGAMVSITVDGDLGEAFDEAVSDLEDYGYKKESVADMGDIRTASLTRGDDEMVQLSTDGDSTLNYVVVTGS